MRRHPFSAVNLISDPIHGYIELTKRLEPRRRPRSGCRPRTSPRRTCSTRPGSSACAGSASSRALAGCSRPPSTAGSPTASGVMHEAGLWARHLYPTLRTALADVEPATALPSEGLVVETLRIAGLLHDVGHGPFAHFFDDQVLRVFPAPSRRPSAGRQAAQPRGPVAAHRRARARRPHRRPAPGAGDLPERDAFGRREAIDPGWVAFLISKPALADPAMPRWVRWLQPLLSGRVHGRQPRLRPARRVPDRGRDRTGRRRAAAPLLRSSASAG